MEKEYNPVELAERWHQEIKLSKREFDKWTKRGKKIIKRYRDERTGSADNSKRYNILWANIQTLFPSMYGRVPMAQVERRNKDQDPVGRAASQILERALQYELDNYQDFDAAMKAAINDRLLPGRGIAWVRFETKEVETAEEGITDISQAYACVDVVYWEDFFFSPARNWQEVTWVARRIYMSKEDGRQRFGEKFDKVPMTHEPLGLDELVKNGEDVSRLKKAQVYEIWDKSSGKVCWVADGCETALDCIDDPYGLDCFWPCPMPLFATLTTDSLVPVPDFALYQDQADEIDLLTQRINLLVKALKVVGVYDASQTGVQRMMSEGIDNTLIPVDTWAAFSEKGGIKGTIDFLPIDMVASTLNQCYAAREQAKQVIYEITGLSDIIRGASIASETATAQQIKSQFASLRLRDMQRSVAVFASEILKIKAQLMADLYPVSQLVEMSGILGTQDAQYVEQAIQLLKTEPARSFRVEVAADSLVEIDEQSEKTSRLEFLTAAGGFLQQTLPVAQQAPEMAPLLAQMLLFGVRSFRASRPLEAAFDEAMTKLTEPKPQATIEPNPEQLRIEAAARSEEIKAQLEQAKSQTQFQIEQLKLQSAQQINDAKLSHEKEIEAYKQESENEREKMRLISNRELQLQLKQLDSEDFFQKLAGDSVKDMRENILTSALNEIQKVAEELNNAIQSQQEISKMALLEIKQSMSAPRKLVRDKNGRAIGVEVNGEVREIIRDDSGKVIGI